MIVSQHKQRSEEWYMERRGLVTASRFDRILTPSQGKPSSAQGALIDELIAESLTAGTADADSTERRVTHEMEYGMELEAEARFCYEMNHAAGRAVTEVGLILHDSRMFGASPDALVGEEGGVEIKCPNLSTHIGYVRGGVLPSSYKCQVHGCMVVTGRKWWDFFSYARHADPFLLRVEWDAFTDKLASELESFAKKYNEARAMFKIPALGG